MTRTEMITRICEMVADLEEIDKLPFLSSKEQVSLCEIKTKIIEYLIITERL